MHYLGERAHPELEQRIGAYLRRIRKADGGWPLYHSGAFDLSATVKAYFALKMIGDLPALRIWPKRAMPSLHMAVHPRQMFSRATCWRCTVSLRGMRSRRFPVELILLPRWFPVHLSKMSYWARTVLTPLLVLQALKPKARNGRNIHIPELFVAGNGLPRGRAAHQNRYWAAFFGALDRVLKVVEPVWPKQSRSKAIQACVEFVDRRINGEDGLGAIFPPLPTAS